MPIITPSEYQALKAAGKIRLSKNATDPAKIDITIDRSEMEDCGKAAILSWLADERKIHTDAIKALDAIKADVNPL